MDVEFESSEEDQQAYLRVSSPLHVWKQAATFFGSYFLYAVPAFLPFFWTAQFLGGVILLAIYSSIWIWIAYRFLRPKHPPTAPAHRTCVRLSPDYLAASDSHALSRVPWRDVESIQSHSRVVQIQLKSTWRFFIPTSAFSTNEDREQFVEQAEQYRLAALDHAVAAMSLDDEIFPRWAQAAKHAIEYENTAEELAYVRWFGIPANKRWNIYVAFVTQLAFLIGSAAVLSWGTLLFWSKGGRPNPDFKDIQVLMYYASVVWFVFAPLATMSVLQWLDRGRMPASLFGPRRIMIAPQGYVLQYAQSITCTNWESLAKIEQNREFIGFKNEDQKYIAVIPKKAFADPLDADDFAEEALLYWEEAKVKAEAIPTDNILHAENAGGENPFRSPQA